MIDLRFCSSGCCLSLFHPELPDNCIFCSRESLIWFHRSIRGGKNKIERWNEMIQKWNEIEKNLRQFPDFVVK